ncbi:hypothetical protein [Janthinobacterium sp. B9-8]|uniref:hypothetical protein n=1 Tax=Janthinobacterium sp. B9-8 TaxID=1236179 RepID=UPI00061D32FE|nr:hypothetical protein [Janthinobacterium sp. B9-8]AMC34540.1 hypothetical protein VN23_07960 [Janthinobacterium sp. B9-8]
MIKLLKSSRWYLWFTLGLLITSIGSGLTAVAVFGALSKAAAAPSDFALTFSMSIVPTLFSSEIGKYLGKWCKPFSVLIAAEIGGVLSLLLPFYALDSGNLLMLSMALALPSLCSGLAVSAYHTINKRGFGEEDYLHIATIETLTFSAITIIGTGIGGVLYPLLSSPLYFALDALSYLLAMACLFYSRALIEDAALNRVDQEVVVKIRFFSLNLEKKTILLIMPLLTLISAPAMALLPVKGVEFNDFKVLGLVINPVLILLFARCIGQLIGPLLTSQKMVDRLLHSAWAKSILGLGFFLMYLFAFYSQYLILVILAVVLAHISSNILFAVSYSTMLNYFSEDEIGAASVFSYQSTTLILAFFSLPPGFYADQYGLVAAMLLFSFPAVWLMLAVFMAVKPKRSLDVKTGCEQPV